MRTRCSRGIADRDDPLPVQLVLSLDTFDRSRIAANAVGHTPLLHFDHVEELDIDAVSPLRQDFSLSSREGVHRYYDAKVRAVRSHLEEASDVRPTGEDDGDGAVIGAAIKPMTRSSVTDKLTCTW